MSELTREEWLEGGVPYPHSKLNVTLETKPQTTRMIKCECATCGFVVRTTRKWLDEVGAPHCPNDGEMEVDGGGE